jgi:opacity protein-like surface antigen
MRKYIIYFSFILFSLNSNAQKIRGITGISAYLDSDFKKSAFIEVGGGLEFKINRLIKPEVGFSYFVGTLENDITRNPQGVAIDILEKKASAINFSFTPKICLSSSEDDAGDISFQILPVYNISKVEAEGNYTIINQSNPSSSVSKKEMISQWQHSLGIGLGIDIALSDKNFDSLAINLYYNGVNMGKVLTALGHNDATYSTNNVFGFGVKYYFGFNKKKN